jgi:hypothetical protein
MEQQAYGRDASGIEEGYSEGSLLKPRQVYRTGFEDTLEGIVQDVPASAGQSFLDTILDDRKTSLRAIVKSLFNEIQSREQLSATMLSEIRKRILDTYTNLHEIRDITSRTYSLDLALQLSRRKTQLEDRMLGLEREKRQEYTASWETLMKLRQYLMTSLKDYWEFARKTAHLGYGDDVEG